MNCATSKSPGRPIRETNLPPSVIVTKNSSDSLSCGLSRKFAAASGKSKSPRSVNFLSAANFTPVRTCREVGEILGISGERVRQIEADALYKLHFRLSKLGTPRELLASLASDPEPAAMPYLRRSRLSEWGA